VGIAESRRYCEVAGLSYDTKFDLRNMVELPWNDSFFSVPPNPSHGQTPKLGSLHIGMNRALNVRDLPTHGKQVMIHLDAPRLMCKPCSKTFTATVPEVDEKRQMTERLVYRIGRQSLDYTFAAVAEQVGMDEIYLNLI
jgi:hypothetical protein